MKIISVPKEWDKEIRCTVRHCDIDINGHANNLTYLDQAAETLPPDISMQNFNTLEVLFKKAAMLGDDLLCRHSSENGVHYLTVVRADDEQLLCIFRLQNT